MRLQRRQGIVRCAARGCGQLAQLGKRQRSAGVRNRWQEIDGPVNGGDNHSRMLQTHRLLIKDAEKMILEQSYFQVTELCSGSEMKFCW